MGAPDDIEAKVASDIAEHGWHVVKVMGDDAAPGWAYTIGLHQRFAHPELAVFGMELEQMHHVLNHMAALIPTGRRFEPGEHEGVFEGLACAVRPVEPRWLPVFFGNASWHYKSDDVPILQVFWPDANGRFPWSSGFAASWRERQPLLFHADIATALAPRLAETLRREGALDDEPQTETPS